jgi:hypothetical protein
VRLKNPTARRRMTEAEIADLVVEVSVTSQALEEADVP